MRIGYGVILALVAASCGCGPNIGREWDAFHSPDEQTRCDAFYDRFVGTDGAYDSPAYRDLVGKSTREVYAIFGKPSWVGQLDFEGDHYIMIVYRFDIFASTAPQGAKEAWQKGWRLGFDFDFRNGKLIAPAQLDRALGLSTYSMTPASLTFKEGGRFP